MVFGPDFFQDNCPKGQKTLEELKSALEATLDGDPDGVLEEISADSDTEEEVKRTILQKFEDDPECCIIGGVLYHTEQVEHFADQWIQHLFRVGLMVDPPDEIGPFINEMVGYMRDLGQDGISDELTAKAFKSAIERCGS